MDEYPSGQSPLSAFLLNFDRRNICGAKLVSFCNDYAVQFGGSKTWSHSQVPAFGHGSGVIPHLDGSTIKNYEECGFTWPPYGGPSSYMVETCGHPSRNGILYINWYCINLYSWMTIPRYGYIIYIYNSTFEGENPPLFVGNDLNQATLQVDPPSPKPEWQTQSWHCGCGFNALAQNMRSDISNSLAE